MRNKTSHIETWDRLKNNDPGALEDLYTAHYTGLINFGIKLTGNRQLTNDCIIQVLLRLWDKRHTLPIIDNPRAYLLTCLRRELLAELKSDCRRAVLVGRIPTDDGGQEPYEEYIIRVQQHSALQNRLILAFARLTPRERELLRMRFFDDLGYDEIAHRCRISKQTAYNILTKALRTLRSEFGVEKKYPAGQPVPIGLIITCCIVLLQNF